MNNWRQIIRDIMKDERVTQGRLAAGSGVSLSTVKRFLRGETSMRFEQLECLLETLGYSLDAVKAADPMPEVVRPRSIRGYPMSYGGYSPTLGAGGI